MSGASLVFAKQEERKGGDAGENSTKSDSFPFPVSTSGWDDGSRNEACHLRPEAGHREV